MLKKYHVSKNLVPPLAEWEDGYISNQGSIARPSDTNKEKSSDYIEIPAGVNAVTFSSENGYFPDDNGAWRAIAFYNSNKTFISRDSGYDVNALTSNVPDNAVYMRVSCRTYGLSIEYMLNSGSSPESYEPHGNTWTEIPYRLYATETDTLTSLPEDIIADGNNTEVLIKGNMQQTGTPSPSSIIMPDETGERTAQLFDYTDRTDIINNSYINQNGSIVTNQEYYISYPIKVEVGATYTWRFNSEDVISRHTAPTVGYYDSNNTLIGTASHSSNVRFFSFTIPPDCKYIRCSVFQRDGNQSEAMLNTGSTALPYEPYGFKLPVESGSVTTSVYLSEPLRKIGEYADEVGETKNLFYASTSETKRQGTATFTTTEGSSEFILSRTQSENDGSFTIPTNIVLPAGTYTASLQGMINRGVRGNDRIALRDNDGNYFQNGIMENASKTFTLTQQTTLAAILGVNAAEAEYDNQVVRVMINEGDAALPYQPYGYAATRPIRKFVLTGTEAINKNSSDVNNYLYYITVSTGSETGTEKSCFCTHLPSKNAAPVDEIGCSVRGAGTFKTIYINLGSEIMGDDNSVARVRQYLATQYAAGTPVTIWYVLAEPTTETITMPTIPTTAGSQTFDVNTSLKPSEVQLTYKGWHKHSPKVYNNGSWT